MDALLTFRLGKTRRIGRRQADPAIVDRKSDPRLHIDAFRQVEAPREAAGEVIGSAPRVDPDQQVHPGAPKSGKLVQRGRSSPNDNL